MALFKTEEQKQAEQMEKETKLLEKYGLDSITNPKDVAALKNIATTMAGAGLIEVGSLMAGTPADRANLAYQRILIEQNFMIIRKLCEISEK